MEQESEQGMREVLAALRHRNGLFSEIQERVYSRGRRSLCSFSGTVAHCAAPESSHCCLASVRRKYADAVKRVRTLRIVSPERFEAPDVRWLEESYRSARRKRSSAISAP
jgi:hypothetical protein